MTNEHQYKTAKAMIDPCLRLFGGEDGGVGYVKLSALVADLLN